jgi:hypothetical protein
MGFWTKSRLIFNAFRDNAKASVRHVARHTGLSKSRVHRLGPSMARRNQQLESWFWETEAGPQWLIRLVIAVFSQVGLRRGVGAETMSEFFAGVPLEQHGGCSPSTLRVVMDTLAHLIVETTEAWERESMAQGQGGPMVGAVDETFLERRMLVCMDLVSGDVWLAEVADDRPDETWYGRGKARLAPMKTRGLSLVSDRAKALIKRAETGVACPSLPAVFPLLHALVKGDSLAIATQLTTARQTFSQAQQHLDTCKTLGTSVTEIE